jgi:DNA-binding GntR family transcriptional regulator
MVRTSEAQTLGLGVYEQLRAAILDGRYRPGERLRPTELCTEYGVSPGVLREAVMRLAEQRLVTVEHNRGYRVTTISSKQIHDLVELRRINEGAALRLSLARGSAAWEGEALAAHHRLKSMNALVHTDFDAWSAAHLDYHMALLSACGNDRLLELCRELFTASELYRRWSGNQPAERKRPEGAKRDQDHEHAQILEAVLDHDVELAVSRYEEHLNRTAELAQFYTDTAAVTS